MGSPSEEIRFFNGFCEPFRYVCHLTWKTTKALLEGSMMVQKSRQTTEQNQPHVQETGGGLPYPEAAEKEQRIAEESLLHLLYEERFREAVMAVRNLDSRSGDFLERITPILEGREDSRPLHERTLKHANRSIQFQEGMMLFAQRRITFFIEGSREKELLSEIISVLVICRHRNDLIRRLLMVSLGQTFHRDRMPAS